MNFTDTSIANAKDFDDRDELRKFRNEFVIHNQNTIYLDGNSPGRLPRKTVEIIKHVVEGRIYKEYSDARLKII